MKKCDICGKPIPDTRTSNATRYCSGKCARKAEASQSMKRITNRAKNINKVAHAVYEAYNAKCALCGWQATEETIAVNGKIQYAHGNEIHHITPLRDGGEETSDNLILLCPNHHKQADLGLITKEELRKHTRAIGLTEEDKERAIAKCADTIADLIFTG